MEIRVPNPRRAKFLGFGLLEPPPGRWKPIGINCHRVSVYVFRPPDVNTHEKITTPLPSRYCSRSIFMKSDSSDEPFKDRMLYSTRLTRMNGSGGLCSAQTERTKKTVKLFKHWRVHFKVIFLVCILCPTLSLTFTIWKDRRPGAHPRRRRSGRRGCRRRPPPAHRASWRAVAVVGLHHAVEAVRAALPSGLSTGHISLLLHHRSSSFWSCTIRFTLRPPKRNISRRRFNLITRPAVSSRWKIVKFEELEEFPIEEAPVREVPAPPPVWDVGVYPARRAAPQRHAPGRRGYFARRHAACRPELFRSEITRPHTGRPRLSRPCPLVATYCDRALYAKYPRRPTAPHARERTRQARPSRPRFFYEDAARRRTARAMSAMRSVPLSRSTAMAPA